MNNELTRYNSIQMNSLEDALNVGAILAQSGFFKDSKNESQAVAKILAGNEIGIPPVAALQGILLVDGKLSLSASLCGALVKKSGRYNYKIASHDERHCSINFYEQWGDKWESVGTSTFTMDDAKLAGLNGKQNWQRYPKAMLFARAMTQGSRWFCPDVFSGSVYSPEELNPNAVLNEEGEVVEVKAVEPRGARPMAIAPSPQDPVRSREHVLLSKKTTSLIEAIAHERGVEQTALTEELRQWADFQGFPRTRAQMTEGQLETLRSYLQSNLEQAIAANNPDEIDESNVSLDNL
ncbi:MAG: hypothetical protein ACRC8Y_05020 [Chroococcales cyanobacterium]